MPIQKVLQNYRRGRGVNVAGAFFYAPPAARFPHEVVCDL